MDNMEVLNNNARKLMVIAGIIMYILGSIGNILNICAFAIWSRSRTTVAAYSALSKTNNSALYLLVSSISNLIVILYPLLTRIIFDGHNYLVSPNQVFILCKLRYFVLHIFDSISLTYVCMATFDQYLITSRDVHIRRMSTTRQKTKQIILGIFIVFSLHNIPIAVYYQVSNTGQCEITTSKYSYYYLYVCQILLHGVIPIIFLFIFGSLTLKHMKNLRSQTRAYGHSNYDKQLAHMLLLMSFAIIISSIPYCITQVYYAMFSGSNAQQSSLMFLLQIISLILFYTNPVSSFYVYFISTKKFRHQIQKLIRCNKCNHFIVHNQIHTITATNQFH
ncbi:unnamed protein product [Rotaria sp. Silwood2]|nr:unnamed protein product [Rotaria sp. Silwood2]CAF3091088.1 unnamed protein product [Rotaria sp. Silwood2]CAF4481779.1 unnamed protein product [Rotaria sp. Silwood2]CAF4614472.1 unnamed protein product [Rotaria sp. Silwood2]